MKGKFVKLNLNVSLLALSKHLFGFISNLQKTHNFFPINIDYLMRTNLTNFVNFSANSRTVTLAKFAQKQVFAKKSQIFQY